MLTLVPPVIAAAAAEFRLTLRVYYEDTDAAGVVYYANYLRYMERARTEWLRALGYEQTLLAQQGIAFAARSVTVDYLKPARLDDAIEVVSSIVSLGRAQLVFAQRIERQGDAGDDLLVDASMRIACFDPVRMKATPIPNDIHERLKALVRPSGEHRA
jgi:acyl-CoA thioester hydrolase